MYKKTLKYRQINASVNLSKPSALGESFQTLGSAHRPRGWVENGSIRWNTPEISVLHAEIFVCAKKDFNSLVI